MKRYFPNVHQGRATRGRGQTGGVHVYGLCASCNTLQSKYDPDYARLADAVRRQLPGDSCIAVPDWVHRFPDVPVRPGAAARSILIGMMALNTKLHEIHPGLADALLREEREVALPDGLALRVACTRSPYAHLHGPIGGVLLFHRIRPGGRALGVMSLAAVHFRPLAWHLAARNYSLLDLQRWYDASGWLGMNPREDVPVRSLFKWLPEVVHPREDPQADDAGWVEMLSDKITVFAEGDIPTCVRRGGPYVAVERRPQWRPRPFCAGPSRAARDELAVRHGSRSPAGRSDWFRAAPTSSTRCCRTQASSRRKSTSARTTRGQRAVRQIKDATAELYFLTLVEANTRLVMLTKPDFMRSSSAG